MSGRLPARVLPIDAEVLATRTGGKAEIFGHFNTFADHRTGTGHNGQGLPGWTVGSLATRSGRRHHGVK